MPEKSLVNKFKNLLFEKKVVFFSSLIVLISSALPWLYDLNTRGDGDVFNAFNSPLYLAGVLIFGCALASLVSIVADLYRVKKPMEDSKIFLILNGAGLGLMLLVVSVFLHNKFGINITYGKSLGIGLYLTFAGLIVSFVCGILIQGKQGNVFESHVKNNFETRPEHRPQKINKNVKVENYYRPDNELKNNINTFKR